jgi:hypothetical protein
MNLPVDNKTEDLVNATTNKREPLAGTKAKTINAGTNKITITNEDLEEAGYVLRDLDKEGKLDYLKDELVEIMAPYYATKRITKKTGDKSCVLQAFNDQTVALQGKVPEKLMKEIFFL